MLKFLKFLILRSVVAIVLIGQNGCQNDRGLDFLFPAKAEGVPESLHFLASNKTVGPLAANKALGFTCANSITYSLTSLTSQVRRNPETRRPIDPEIYDPTVVESGSVSSVDELKFRRFHTMPFASHDMAKAIVAELEERDVIPRCQPSRKGSDINITFIEAFHLDESESFLPKHVKVVKGRKDVIQIAVVLGYRQLIRDYVGAKTDAFQRTNHHFTLLEFRQWAGYFQGDLYSLPSDKNGRLISSEATLNNVPSDILEFFQNTPGMTRVGYGSIATAAFNELQGRSVPVYAELVTGLVQSCLSNVCVDDAEYVLRDWVSGENYEAFIQRLSLK